MSGQAEHLPQTRQDNAVNVGLPDAQLNRPKKYNFATAYYYATYK